MSTTELPTIKVHNPAEPGGWMIINLTDFDPEQHKVLVQAGANEAPVEESPVEPEAPKAKKGRK